MVIIDESELGGLDAVETARRVRDGELSAVEVVAAAIERARALDPHLNAIPFADYGAAARRAEQAPTGPFAGVPSFVKALDDVAGQVNDRGSRVLRGAVARRTEPYVARMLETGIVSLGRSAAPEIGLNATTESLAYGPTRNPWDPTRSVGGSSGGAAALVAARVVPLAQGTDAGGSIRIPSSACGLVGLKPSRARGFTAKVAQLLPVRIVTYGALTRSVRDSAHFVAAMEARMPRAKLPPIGLIEGPAGESRLRIGVFTDSPLGNPIDPEVRAATLATAERCQRLGHEVEALPCPYEGRVLEDFWTYLGFIAQGGMLQSPLVLRGRADFSLFEPWTRGLAGRFRQRWKGMGGVIRRLRAVARVSERAFERFDLLLCPTTASLPPAIGEIAPDQPFEATLERQMHYIAFTPIQNLSGEPAISLPIGRSRAGWPIGVQAAAAPGGEAKLLALAYALEEHFVQLDPSTPAG